MCSLSAPFIPVSGATNTERHEQPGEILHRLSVEIARFLLLRRLSAKPQSARKRERDLNGKVVDSRNFMSQYVPILCDTLFENTIRGITDQNLRVVLPLSRAAHLYISHQPSQLHQKTTSNLERLGEFPQFDED